MKDHCFVCGRISRSRHICLHVHMSISNACTHMYHVCECVYIRMCVYIHSIGMCISASEKKRKRKHFIQALQERHSSTQRGSAGSFHITKMSYVIRPCQMVEICTYSWLPPQEDTASFIFINHTRKRQSRKRFALRTHSIKRSGGHDCFRPENGTTSQQKLKT